MKKAVLSGVRKFEIVEIRKPTIADTSEVLLRVKTVGVCGSDLHYFKEGRIGSQVVKFPFTIGHECSAVVEEVGNNVQRVKPGDMVAIDPCISCGQCSQCLNGREHTCLNQRFLGSPGQAEGCLQEFLVIPEKNCYPVPARFTPELAALVEPLSIGHYAVKLMVAAVASQRSSAIGDGHLTSAVLGVGPIGLGTLMFLRRVLRGTIMVTDRLGYRLGAARKLGASLTVNADSGDVIGSAMNVNPEMFDVAFECCGQQEALDQAIELLKPGGLLFIVGIPELDRVSFDMNLLRRKEIAIYNVRRQNKSMQPVIDAIASGECTPEMLVTHRFTLERTAAAFSTAANYQDGVLKAVIEL